MRDKRKIFVKSKKIGNHKFFGQSVLKSFSNLKYFTNPNKIMGSTNKVFFNFNPRIAVKYEKIF